MQTEQESLRQILNEGTKGSFEQESLGTPQAPKVAILRLSLLDFRPGGSLFCHRG